MLAPKLDLIAGQSASTSYDNNNDTNIGFSQIRHGLNKRCYKEGSMMAVSSMDPTTSSEHQKVKSIKDQENDE